MNVVLPEVLFLNEMEDCIVALQHADEVPKLGIFKYGVSRANSAWPPGIDNRVLWRLESHCRE
jgi:hypothetical protein